MEENKNKEEKTKFEDILPSEAISAFVLWLSRRHISTTLSIAEDSRHVYRLAYKFYGSQGWELPRLSTCSERFKPFPEEDTHEKFKGIIESHKLNHGSGTDSDILASHLLLCLENYERTQMQVTKKG